VPHLPGVVEAVYPDEVESVSGFVDALSHMCSEEKTPYPSLL